MEKYIDNGHVNLASSFPQFTIALLFTFFYVLEVAVIWTHVNLNFYFSFCQKIFKLLGMFYVLTLVSDKEKWGIMLLPMIAKSF